ncbi:MAG: hypothetical protein WA459_16865 [Stellaceae bacterium]
MFEQSAQALRNGLLENMVIKRVEKGFALVPAREKVADIPVDHPPCDPGFHREVFYGEVHGNLFLPLLEIQGCNSPWRCARFWHVGVSLMSKCQQFVTRLIPMQNCKAAMHFCAGWVGAQQQLRKIAAKQCGFRARLRYDRGWCWPAGAKRGGRDEWVDRD